MEPARGSEPNPDPSPSERGSTERPSVRRVVRQRQAPTERGRQPAPPAPAKAAPATKPTVTAVPENTGPHPCPFCGGEVSAQAVVCRHCGRDLVAGSGARLVLPAEKWNTNVPPWMLEKERAFLRRRQKLSHVRRWAAQAVLALIVVGIGAILYRVYTAPVEPGRRRVLRGPAGHESAVSNLAMASENQEPAVPVAPSAAEPLSDEMKAKPARADEVATTLPAAALVRAFEKDHEHANELYQDQLVRVSGRVETLHGDTEVPYLTLHSPTSTELRCYLNSASVGKMGHLRPGTAVVIQGRCQGWFNNIAIADCDLP